MRATALCAILLAACTTTHRTVEHARITLYTPRERACAESCSTSDDAFDCLAECEDSSVSAGPCKQEPPAEVMCAEHVQIRRERGAVEVAKGVAVIALGSIAVLGFFVLFQLSKEHVITAR